MTTAVLFLCTGNSARSVLGEAVLNHVGVFGWRGFSAGSHPRGQVHPDALATLSERGISVDGLHSKSWDVFATGDAAGMDVIITVCDSAAAEVCPVWPGAPLTVHWGLPDPAAVADPGARRRAFADTFDELHRRISAMVRLDPKASGFAASLRDLGNRQAPAR